MGNPVLHVISSAMHSRKVIKQGDGKLEFYKPDFVRSVQCAEFITRGLCIECSTDIWFDWKIAHLFLWGSPNVRAGPKLPLSFSKAGRVFF